MKIKQNKRNGKKRNEHNIKETVRTYKQQKKESSLHYLWIKFEENKHNQII